MDHLTTDSPLTSVIPLGSNPNNTDNLGPPPLKKARKGGRVTGVQNWNTTDQQTLLALLEQHPPVNKAVWRIITEKYNSEYATTHARTIRTPDSLEKAFRMMV